MEKSRQVRQEWRDFISILGKDNVPDSLSKFKRIKYNKGREYRELKEAVVWSKAKFPSKKSLKWHYEVHCEEYGDITMEEYQ